MPTKKTRTARKSNVPENETPSEKFLRLTNMRMPKVLNSIKLTRNLAHYPHTAEHAEKILTALSNAVQEVAVAFTAEKPAERPKFSL